MKHASMKRAALARYVSSARGGLCGGIGDRCAAAAARDNNRTMLFGAELHIKVP
jgi:hypothetical protein